MSARTGSWKKAEALATTELAKRDPIPQRLQEIENQETAKRASEAAKLAPRATIPPALPGWDNETHQAHTPGSASVLRTFIRKAEAWAVEQGLQYIDEITGTLLTNGKRSGRKPPREKTIAWVHELKRSPKAGCRSSLGGYTTPGR
jgi:hypothetical protein